VKRRKKKPAECWYLRTKSGEFCGGGTHRCSRYKRFLCFAHSHRKPATCCVRIVEGERAETVEEVKRSKKDKVRCITGSGFFGGGSCSTWKMYVCSKGKKKVFFCSLHNHLSGKCCVEVDEYGNPISKKNECLWKSSGRCDGTTHHCRATNVIYCMFHAQRMKCCHIAERGGRAYAEDSVYVHEDVPAFGTPAFEEKLWSPNRKMQKERDCKFVRVAGKGK